MLEGKGHKYWEHLENVAVEYDRSLEFSYSNPEPSYFCSWYDRTENHIQERDFNSEISKIGLFYIFLFLLYVGILFWEKRKKEKNNNKSLYTENSHTVNNTKIDRKLQNEFDTSLIPNKYGSRKQRRKRQDVVNYNIDIVHEEFKQKEILITHDTLYKPLYKNILPYLASKNILKLYHFTDVQNLETIIENGGLYSWKGLENKGINASLSSNELSRQLDTQKNLQDYIRLSFADYHPMSTKVEKDNGKKLVWLEIDLEVALLETTLFSDMNATDNTVTVKGDFGFLKTLDFSVFKQRYSNLDSLQKKKYQAEILIKNFLPIKYIKNIDILKEKYFDYEEIPF